MNVNNEFPLVSIVVPVYNVGKYLRQCLDSLVMQTLRNIEIIIVNDGSTDDSASICREYAEKDDRIVLINKENGGLSSARQAGLSASRGKYFCTCDADDWVEHDMYELLYGRAVETDADIVMCDYWNNYSDGKQIATVYGYSPGSRDDLLGDVLNGRMYPSIWAKMFRTDLLVKNGISWEPGINLGEDFFLMLKVFQHKVKVEYVPNRLYHYRREINGNSYTNDITMNTFQQMQYIDRWANAYLDTERYANGLFRLKITLCYLALRVKDGMTPQYYRANLLHDVPLSGFIKYKCPKLKGMLVIISKLSGYRSARWVYKLIYKHVYHLI